MLDCKRAFTFVTEWLIISDYIQLLVVWSSNYII